MIVECWYQSADGRASASGSIPLFATSPVYTEIKPARAGLTAFAAQLVEKELVKEARRLSNQPVGSMQHQRSGDHSELNGWISEHLQSAELQRYIGMSNSRDCTNRQH